MIEVATLHNVDSDVHSNVQRRDDIDNGTVFDMLVNGLLPTNTTLNSGISI